LAGNQRSADSVDSANSMNSANLANLAGFLAATDGSLGPVTHGFAPSDLDPVLVADAGLLDAVDGPVQNAADAEKLALGRSCGSIDGFRGDDGILQQLFVPQ